MLSLDVAGDSTTFTISMYFVNATATGRKKLESDLRNEIFRATRGVFGITLDMGAIENKVEYAYKMVRKEMNLLFNDLSLYIDTKVIDRFFNIPNTASGTIKVGILSWNWASLKYPKEKESRGGASVQKIDRDREFVDTFHALRTIREASKLSIVVGFIGMDSGKVMANEYGKIGYGQDYPPRPILEPIYRAIEHGLRTDLLPYLRKKSAEFARYTGEDISHMSIIKAVRDYRAEGNSHFSRWFAS